MKFILRLIGITIVVALFCFSCKDDSNGAVSNIKGSTPWKNDNPIFVRSLKVDDASGFFYYGTEQTNGSLIGSKDYEKKDGWLIYQHLYTPYSEESGTMCFAYINTNCPTVVYFQDTE